MTPEPSPHRDRPEIPTDLTPYTLVELGAWKTALVDSKCGIEAQLSNMNRQINDRPMTAVEYHSWRTRAIYAKSRIEIDIRRVNQAIRERSQRGAGTGKVKLPVFPGLLKLAQTLADWEEAPIEVHDAAVALTAVLEAVLGGEET